LNAAHQIINRQNEELLTYAKNLEGEVMRRTEQIRENSERLSEYADQMEKFTYAISHNLRAPIARLLGLVSIISPGMAAEELAFFLSKVKESSVQLDDVIKDLSLILELKAEKHNDIEEIDLRARINSALALHGDLVAEVDPKIFIDFQVERVQGIGSLVDSILYNLIGNSLKFREPGRDLIIRLNSYREGSYIVLRCEDNGIGIDLSKHGDKLFGLYKRFETKIDGKGLGLYLVKSHVNALNGVVTVESAPGKGAAFVIKLPANQAIRTGEPRSENVLI
jgi:signal transduction histidine kinase